MSKLSISIAKIVAILLVFSVNAYSQNLIRNADFEEFASFSGFDFGYKDLENNITTWRNPTQASPRIYADEQSAKSGRIFAGIHCYGVKDYREYISSPLNCRLIAGETYVLRMYIKLAENSEFAISNIGALFTTDRPDLQTVNRILDTPQISVINYKFFNDQRAWVIVEDSFTATGQEAYVTIGNFLSDEETVSKKVARLAREGRAYYYIDDVKLYPKNAHNPCDVLGDSTDCEIPISDYNLIRDASFECYKTCPSSINTDELSQLNYWQQTGPGTPDYFHDCSIIMSVPKNVMGIQDAKSGHGYVGMYMFDQNNYREFITTKLTKPMVKERWYVIKLWAALSENSNIATDAFEFLISDKLTNIDTTALDKIKPQVINEPGNFADSYDWKMICGMYLAEGGEQYITLGNFKIDAATPKKSMGSKKGNFAYYFIDDFTVEPLNDDNMTDCGAGVPEESEPELTTTRYFEDLSFPQLLNNEPFTFKDFFFEFDKYDILDTNYYFLDSLVIMLEDNPDLSIEVHGHTDDVGSEAYNEKLSKNRALTVVNYIIEQGIDKKRIKYDYFGAKRPVASNRSADGRQRNRRVEFTIRRK